MWIWQTGFFLFHGKILKWMVFTHSLRPCNTSSQFHQHWYHSDDKIYTHCKRMWSHDIQNTNHVHCTVTNTLQGRQLCTSWLGWHSEMCPKKYHLLHNVATQCLIEQQRLKMSTYNAKRCTKLLSCLQIYD